MKTSSATKYISVWLVALTFYLSAWSEAGCTEEQSGALLGIRDSTNGSAFADYDGNNCCGAKAIVCESGKVTGIYLESDSAPSGIWYPNVTSLTVFDDLEELILDGMNIGGTLQPFCQLKQLKHLGVIDLGHNKLEGIIPTCLGMIQSLEILHLESNDFQGNIPSSIFSNLTKIQWFDVSRNQLGGLLPFSIFANSSSLSYLDLSNNEMEVETESPSWVPSFSLNYLNLESCKLNKKNGHIVPSFISTQHELALLDLSHNSLEGSIPCQLLFNMTSITGLYLSSNEIKGSFLDCSANHIKVPSLAEFDISDNHINGPLPKDIGGLLPLLKEVNMSSNLLEGYIPWSFGDLPLVILDLSKNMLSGTIPSSLTSNEIPLVYLNLSSNKLEGKMLPNNSMMTRLECLQLGGNHFEGTISPTVLNSPSLVILDVRNNNLSGEIPPWLYDHPRLVAILFRGNHLEGRLSRGMCRMERLQVFDISHNRLSGGIPSCLDNITFWKKSSSDSNYFPQEGRLSLWTTVNHGLEIETSFQIKNNIYTFKGLPLRLMTIIDFSSNQLSGNIPSKMGKLTQLLSLNLSNNFLTGSIPISFRDLKSIESLDLSHNRLKGKIPHELVGLTFLSVFSVAYNNLSGRIPFEQQFATFSAQCYEGNPELCGDHLPRKCSSTNQPGHEDKSHHMDEKGGTRIIDSPIFLYAFVFFSYAFGFWAFFGVLIINKSWRHKYFSAVDRYIESCFGML